MLFKNSNLRIGKFLGTKRSYAFVDIEGNDDVFKRSRKELKLSNTSFKNFKNETKGISCPIKRGNNSLEKWLQEAYKTVCDENSWGTLKNISDEYLKQKQQNESEK